jgi:hypothetical protein
VDADDDEVDESPSTDKVEEREEVIPSKDISSSLRSFN